MSNLSAVVVAAFAGAAVLGVASIPGRARRAVRSAAARRRLGVSLVSSRIDPAAGPASTTPLAWPSSAGSSWLRRRLVSAGCEQRHGLVGRAWLGLTAAGGVVGWVLGGAGLAGLGAALGLAAVPAGLVAADGRADRQVEAAVPGLLEAVARSLRSGASLPQAVAEAAEAAPGSLSPDLARLRSEVSGGLPLVRALDAWAQRRPLPGVRLAVGALALGSEAGGVRARAIDGVAETLRARLAIAAEVRALAAQARLSAVVIAVAPLGFALLAASADSATSSFLLETPAGQACLAAGLGLDLLGALWMQRLCRLEP